MDLTCFCASRTLLDKLPASSAFNWPSDTRRACRILRVEFSSANVLKFDCWTVDRVHPLCTLWSSVPLRLRALLSLKLGVRRSGVTRVGVTRGGNWWCHPIIIEKLTTFFSHRPGKWWPFCCRLLTAPIFPRRLSGVRIKFSQKKLIIGRVSPPLEGVTRGGSPRSDATVLHSNS